MRKDKKLSSKELHFLAMIKYEFETFSKIMVIALPFIILLFIFLGNESANPEDGETMTGLFLIAILVLFQSIFFLVILRKFRGQLAEYLKRT